MFRCSVNYVWSGKSSSGILLIWNTGNQRKASKRQGAKNFREKHSLKELLTGVLCTVDHRKQSVLLLPTGITNIPLQYPRYLQRIQIPMTNIS